MDERTYNIYKSIIESTGNFAKANTQRNHTTREVTTGNDKAKKPRENQNTNEQKFRTIAKESGKLYSKYRNNRMGSVNRKAYQQSYGRNYCPESYHNYRPRQYNSYRPQHGYYQRKYPKYAQRRYSVSPIRNTAEINIRHDQHEERPRTQEEINSERRGATPGPGRGQSRHHGSVETVSSLRKRIDY